MGIKDGELMDDLIGMAILLMLAMAVIAIITLVLALRYLGYKYKHSMKVASGHFKVTLSKADWDAGVASEAFAVAVKNQNTGEVMLTVIVSKEK